MVAVVNAVETMIKMDLVYIITHVIIYKDSSV